MEIVIPEWLTFRQEVWLHDKTRSEPGERTTIRTRLIDGVNHDARILDYNKGTLSVCEADWPHVVTVLKLLGIE